MIDREKLLAELKIGWAAIVPLLTLAAMLAAIVTDPVGFGLANQLRAPAQLAKTSRTSLAAPSPRGAG